MPLFHVAGCGLLTLGLAQTLGTHVLMPRFDPGLELELTETYRGALIGGVPTMLTALLGHPSRAQRDLSCLRYALSGGATVPGRAGAAGRGGLRGPVRDHVRADRVQLLDHDDQGRRHARRPAGDARPAAAADRGQDHRRATGETVPCGTVGEICTRGYLVMQGYLGDPEATDAAIDPDGWLHTGDLGSMDERGYCRIAGRIKEMIIRGGENIYPREIETVLLSHHAVAEAAVVGVADRFWGEVVGAVIRPSAATPTEAELAGFCRAPARRLQGPGPLAVHQRLPAHRDRQDPQGRAQRSARRGVLPAALARPGVTARHGVHARHAQGTGVSHVGIDHRRNGFRRLVHGSGGGPGRRTVRLLVRQPERVNAALAPLGISVPDIVTRCAGTDDTATRQELGIEPPRLEQTLADTIRWMVQARHLPARLAGNLPQHITGLSVHAAAMRNPDAAARRVGDPEHRSGSSW